MNDLEGDFLIWAARNPNIVGLFFRFADQAWDSGRRTLGAKLIVERIRWETMVESQGDDFKVNNNYTAYLARMYVRQKPDRSKLFRFREVRG